MRGLRRNIVMSSTMTSHVIKAALMGKYSIDPAQRPNLHKGRDEWVCYDEFYSTTDQWGRGVSICDFMALRLYKGCNIVGHEIKISRADFRKDVENFQEKQGDIMEFTTEFYYVCPWGLIEKDEVPEGTGLMWVNKGKKVVIKKHAQHRPKDHMPFGTFKSFVARQARGIERMTIPIKYAGEEITESHFMEIVKEYAEKQIDELKQIKWDEEFKKAVSEVTDEYKGKIEVMNQLVPFNLHYDIFR